MSIVWNGAKPHRLPPLRLREALRLGLRALAVLGATLVMFVVFVVCRGVDLVLKVVWRDRPAVAPWVVHLWGRLALPLGGLSYRQIGRPMALPGALVANHVSWLDIVVLMRATRIFFVSKAEVRDWPGIGLIGRAIGTVFIERRPAEAKRQQALLYGRLKRGDRLVIFAEGTSTDGRRVLPFKSALFEAFFADEMRDSLWIQPVTLVYHAPRGLPDTFYGWWGGMGFATSVRDVLGRGRGGHVEVVFHEPLRVRSCSSRKALAERAHALVREPLEAQLGLTAPAARAAGV